MISEHIEACDKLIASAQEILDTIESVPATARTMRMQVRAEDLVKTCEKYKENSLGLYDEIFNYMKEAGK
jgi:hypothetical protein